jgi:hypothetical protein
MKELNEKWLNKFNRDEWWDKKLKIWDVVYAYCLSMHIAFPD